MIKHVLCLTILLSTLGCGEEKDDTMLKPFLKKTEEKTYVIFSPLSGVLMKEGQPLANTKIIRKLTWNANEEGVIEEFYTDEQGRFDIPQYDAAFKMGVLTEFVASQYLSIEPNAKDDIFWVATNRSGEVFAELGYQPEDLICDVSFERKIPEENMKDTSGLMATKCQWKRSINEKEF